ncbi:MAG TPA: hypothetical protein VK514_11105, partial [Candidatus Acidoferrum sp.]|nr:hypothetical protein [Candidatus Acidoferrum sp.]
MFSKLEKAAPDSRLHRTERLSKLRSNLVMRAMPEKSQLDRLSLVFGQVIQQRSHMSCLVFFVSGIRCVLNRGCISCLGNFVLGCRLDYNAQPPVARP